MQKAKEKLQIKSEWCYTTTTSNSRKKVKRLSNKKIRRINKLELKNTY